MWMWVYLLLEEGDRHCPSLKMTDEGRWGAIADGFAKIKAFHPLALITSENS
jgi:hypothetical protein